MKKYDNIVNIRSIQHYLYCCHRWGLIEFDCSFAENFYVYRGNLVHQNVDNNKCIKSRGVIHENSVKVYNDEWGIYGVIDCLELRKNKDGAFISKYDDNFLLTVVEYKATSPKEDKFRYEDKMQLLAQKICVDNLFNTNSKTYFYYANTKKRISVDFIEEDYNFLKKTIKEMLEFTKNEEIPPINPKQHCSGCSIKNICLPIKTKG